MKKITKKESALSLRLLTIEATLTSFARGINQSIVKPYIQEEVAEDIQATALSVFDMLYRAFIAVFGLIVNWAANSRIEYGMMAAAAITITMYLIFKLNEKRYV